MGIEQCFKILELDNSASPDEIKQAYKDIINVWHPDRFTNNPRLKQKAEEKLKEVNAAYDTLKSYLSTGQQMVSKQEKAQANESVSVNKTKSKARYKKPQLNGETYEKTEAVFEVGTGIALSLWSYLSSFFQRAVTEVKTGVEQGEFDRLQRGAGAGGKGGRRGKGMRRGKGGMGKGGR